MRRLVTVIMLCVFSAGACTYTDPEPEARTYYESLDLSSPIAAAETFVEAFAQDDFMTVWLVFDSRAQQEWKSNVNLLQMSELVSLDDEMRQALTDVFSDLMPVSSDYWYVFDRTMLLARDHDALLIDVVPTELTMTTINDDGTAIVTGEFAGIDGEVEIKLTETPDGRWRVRQILVPGGDEESIPWGFVR